MIEIVKYRQINKGCLQGMVDCINHQDGTFHGNISVFMKDGRRWVNNPQLEWTDEKGEKKYKTLSKYCDKGKNDAFKAAVISAIDRYASEPKKDFMEIINDKEPISDEELPF